MLHTNDIYMWMAGNLIIRGYSDIAEVPNYVLKEAIKSYLQVKLSIKDTSLSLDELFLKLENEIEEENKVKMMSNLIFYILSYMSEIQEYEIIWQINEEIENPTMTESSFSPGKLDSLITKENINYLETFNFVLNVAETLSKKEGRSR